MSQPASDQLPLSGWEEQVLELMSGLLDGRRYTVAEVAKGLGLSDAEVISLLSSAKRKLNDPDWMAQPEQRRERPAPRVIRPRPRPHSL